MTEEKLNNAYTERMIVVRMLALKSGVKYGIGKDDNESWEDQWRNVVYIDLPEGQVSWHIAPHDMHLFDDFPTYQGEWDGNFNGRSKDFAKKIRPNQLTKTPENVSCAAVSNAGESMDEKKRAALEWLKRFVETDGHGNYDTILAVLQAPSVCTHSGGELIETVPKSVADKLAVELAIIRQALDSSWWARIDAALAEYNNFKQVE